MSEWTGKGLIWLNKKTQRNIDQHLKIYFYTNLNLKSFDYLKINLKLVKKSSNTLTAASKLDLQSHLFLINLILLTKMSIRENPLQPYSFRTDVGPKPTWSSSNFIFDLFWDWGNLWIISLHFKWNFDWFVMRVYFKVWKQCINEWACTQLLNIQ